MNECEVDHEARRAMGLLACYRCDLSLQSIEEANAVRKGLGKEDGYVAVRGGVMLEPVDVVAHVAALEAENARLRETLGKIRDRAAELSEGSSAAWFAEQLEATVHAALEAPNLRE